jgi:hypothetical protein
MFEENVKLVNEIIEEEEKNRKNKKKINKDQMGNLMQIQYDEKCNKWIG